MSSAHPSIFAALHKAKTDRTAPKPPLPDWSWRTSGTRGVFYLHRGDDPHGMVSLLPGKVAHESVAMDQIVDIFNTHHKGNQ